METVTRDDSLFWNLDASSNQQLYFITCRSYYSDYRYIIFKLVFNYACWGLKVLDGYLVVIWR